MDTEVRQLVVFTLDNQGYGIDISMVREIITMQTITPVARSRQYIEGIINLRGKVIPIYNIKKKFQMIEGPLTASGRIVVVEVEKNVVGIIVDGVKEVLTISNAIIEKPSGVLEAGVDDEYIDGIAKMGNELIMLLKLEKILSKTELGHAV